MKNTDGIRFVAVMVAAVASVASATGAESAKPIELRERLNRRWTRELVTYVVSFPPDTCHVDSVRLQLGPGAIPCQLSNVRCWPDSEFVREATLAFLVDLAPLETNRYTLHYAAEAAEGDVAETDLKVSHHDDHVEVTTSYIGVRLHPGAGKFADAVRSSKVPGPLVAMRTADGKWFGGSHLFGKTKLTSYSARVVESRPTRAESAYPRSSIGRA